MRYALIAVLASAAALPLAAQQAPPPLPEGYTRGVAPKAGAAPKMKVTEFARAGRIFEVVLGKGDEILSAITEFAEKNKVETAHFTAVGAVDKATLGWFDPEKRAYRINAIDEEAEIASFVGNIATGANGKPSAHGHIVLGMKDGSTRGGHLVEGYISLTLQLFVEEVITNK